MEAPPNNWALRSTKRIPPEETTDLYPGLCVDDERVGGAITISQSRLPVWAIMGTLIEDGWEAVVEGWDHVETDYGWTKEDMSNFLYFLTEPRGEFGRLLLLLAEMERRACSNGGDPPWYQRPESRVRVREQLQRCIGVLDRIEAAQ
ncbi:MAG: hypothetical protein H8F28_17850 [Fibrella sp.]|nr:hypothetical protein [Armatimonadota bacterium]